MLGQPPLTPACPLSRLHPKSGLPDFGIYNRPKSDLSDFGWRVREGAPLAHARVAFPPPPPPPSGGGGGRQWAGGGGGGERPLGARPPTRPARGRAPLRRG